MNGRGKWNDDRMVWDVQIQGQGDMGLHICGDFAADCPQLDMTCLVSMWIKREP